MGKITTALLLVTLMCIFNRYAGHGSRLSKNNNDGFSSSSIFCFICFVVVMLLFCFVVVLLSSGFLFLGGGIVDI